MLSNSRIVLGAFALAVVLSSCSSLSRMNSSDNDDVYLDPHKDRAYFYAPDAQPQQSQTSAATQRTAPQDSSNNPYYKDRDFNYDDYYDNQYASRIRRFHTPTYGMGYYDSYYTNSYFYNGNPYQYGVSIYNGYNFWGPSYNNYMYVPTYNWGGYYGYGTNYGYNSYCGSGFGMSMGYGYGSGYYGNAFNPFSYGYNPYGPYGYNSFYNPYYSPYGYGYSPYGYSNAYDYNSYSYYGPRVTHTGNNSHQVINPGMEPMKLMSPGSASANNNPQPAAVAPTDIKRFNEAPTPQQVMYTKGNVNTDNPHTMNPDLNNGASNPHTMNPNMTNNGSVVQPPHGKETVLTQPAGGNNTAATTPSTPEPSRPKKGFFNSDPVGTYNNNNVPSSSSSTNGGDVKPKRSFFNSEPVNNGNSGNYNNNSKPSYSTPSYSKPSSSFPSGGGGGGVRSSGGGGGGIRPR